jgi:hypothetical protein
MHTRPTVYRPQVLIVITALGCLLLTGCPEDTTVKATCVPGKEFSADFGPSRVDNLSIGLINTHHFKPGHIVELIEPVVDGQKGTGSVVSTVANTGLDQADPPATLSAVVTSDFKLDGDANVINQFSAQIQAELASSTKLSVTEGQRQSITKPLETLSRDGEVTKMILAHPDRIYVYVTGAVYAKGLDLTYQKSQQGGSSVNVIKLGTFNVHTSYDCSNLTSLHQVDGSPKPAVAFFYTTLKAQNGQVTTVSTVDLSKYNLVNALK